MMGGKDIDVTDVSIYGCAIWCAWPKPWIKILKLARVDPAEFYNWLLRPCWQSQL
jgi:hypothetical protein